jgi:hypothetical protein
MADAMDRGCDTYDLVGADDRRINRYKAKFNPTLRQCYNVERGSAAVSVAAHLYKQFRASTGLGLKN